MSIKELEICKSSIHKKENKNVWTLFNKKAHRANNRKATYQELKHALDNWTNTETEKFHGIFHFLSFSDPEKEKDYLMKTLKPGESTKDKKIICLSGNTESHFLKTGEWWCKIIYYDSHEKQYYLRNFTKLKSYDNKILTPSQTEGWFIDFSTLNAPAEFWDYLKDNLEDPNEKRIKRIKITKKDYKFWHNLETVQTRERFIEIIKEKLTDEEIIYLCEKI